MKKTEYKLTVIAKNRNTILRIVELIEEDGISEHEIITTKMEVI